MGKHDQNVLSESQIIDKKEIAAEREHSDSEDFDFDCPAADMKQEVAVDGQARKTSIGDGALKDILTGRAKHEFIN